ncbi:MAG: hypothetical protein ACSHXK_04550 [Oceanococcus sp.]
MSTSLIIGTILAFAIGTAVAWIQARRRMRVKVRDHLVLEAEKRIKQELIRRLSERAAKDLVAGEASASPQSKTKPKD